jgi:hypothetical protein
MRRTQKQKPLARRLPPAGCAHCGKPRPVGQLPFEWDVQVQRDDGKSVATLTCSWMCRLMADVRERDRSCS